MIRINLLGTERKGARKKSSFGLAQKITVGCTMVVILTALVIGWRFWLLRRDSAKLVADIASAKRETARLQSVISQVQQFEAEKAKLEQRVALIERLRSEQTGPVHMLDQISRGLPPMLWLTALKQTPEGSDVAIEGQSTTVTAVSDFVANLESSGYFKKPIEIVSSTTQSTTAAPGELVSFQLKAVFQTPSAPKPAAAGARAAPATQGGATRGN